MAEMHVLTALYSKYAYVMGALRSSELDADKHRADLEHIAATIKLFKPDWTGDGIKPRKAHKPNRWPSRGGGMQTALSVLRQATEPLTTREIVVRVLEHHKMPEPHYDEIKQIMASFNGALRNRIGRGVVLIDANYGDSCNIPLFNHRLPPFALTSVPLYLYRPYKSSPPKLFGDTLPPSL